MSVKEKILPGYIPVKKKKKNYAIIYLKYIYFILSILQIL